MIILRWSSYTMIIFGYHWLQSQLAESISHSIAIGTSICLSWHRRTILLSRYTMDYQRQTWRMDTHTRIMGWPYPSSNPLDSFSFTRPNSTPTSSKVSYILAPRVLRIFYHYSLSIPCDGAIWRRRQDTHNLHEQHTSTHMEHSIACDPRRFGGRCFPTFSVFLVLLPIDSIEILNHGSIQIVKVYTKSSLSTLHSILFRLIS